MKTIACQTHQTVVCGVGGVQEISDAEWDAWLDMIRTSREPVTKVLIRSGDGVPRARQRESLFALTRQKKVKFAMLTDSRIARMVTTSFKWMGGIELEAFPSQDVAGACAYLDLPPDCCSEFDQVLNQLEQALAGNQLA